MTVEVVDEPWLIRGALIQRTKRGRVLPERGRRVLRRARESDGGAPVCFLPADHPIPGQGRAGTRPTEQRIGASEG